MSAHLKYRLSILALSFLALCCATLRSINLFPETKDIELGAQVDQEIRKDSKQYPILQVPAID